MADDAPRSTALALRAPTPPVLTFEEKYRMAKAFAASRLFGAKDDASALSLILLGEAEGMHPALAVQEFDIIEGKPARKAERIQARFQMIGGKIVFHELTEKICRASFSHPEGSDCEITWTIKQAEEAGLYPKKDNWRKYPRAMLRARVVSEGCKTCYPAYAIVTLSTEEALDIEPVSIETVAPIDRAQIEAEASDMADAVPQDEEPEQIRMAISDLPEGLVPAKFCGASDGAPEARATVERWEAYFKTFRDLKSFDMMSETMTIALQGKISNNRIYYLQEQALRRRAEIEQLEYFQHLEKEDPIAAELERKNVNPADIVDVTIVQEEEIPELDPDAPPPPPDVGDQITYDRLLSRLMDCGDASQIKAWAAHLGSPEGQADMAKLSDFGRQNLRDAYDKQAAPYRKKKASA